MSTEQPALTSGEAGIRFAINGRFLGQRLTGVQRVASELLAAVDAELAAAGRPDWCLLAPPGATLPPLRAIRSLHVGKPGHHPHWWEQVALPSAAGGLRLINLAGGAPWLHRRQSCLLHDAAVFDTPQAYRVAFRWWYQALFRHLARSRADLMTVSEFSRQRLAAHLHIPSSGIEVLRSGADHARRIEPLTPAQAASLWQRLGLAQGQPFFLAVGSANPNKNHPLLLHAWQALPAPRIPLVVAGGDNPHVFGPQAASGGTGWIRTGALTDPELFHLYRNALALLFPSRYEGFGLPPLEAMACGCAVVASPAVAEACSDAAVLLDASDASAWTDAMQRIGGDTAFRQSLQQRGTARAAQFRWADAARQLIAHVDKQ